MKYLITILVLTSCSTYKLTNEQIEECDKLEEAIYSGQSNIELPSYCDPLRHVKKEQTTK